MSNVDPIPQGFPIVDNDGAPTTAFISYLDQVLKRIGGIKGGSYSQLADGAFIIWDLDQSPNAVIVLGGNRAIASPINMIAGLLNPYRLTLVQDAMGGRIVAWGSAFKFSGAAPPTLSTAPNSVDEFWFSSDGTNMKLIATALDLR